MHTLVVFTLYMHNSMIRRQTWRLRELWLALGRSKIKTWTSLRDANRTTKSIPGRALSDRTKRNKSRHEFSATHDFDQIKINIH